MYDQRLFPDIFFKKVTIEVFFCSNLFFTSPQLVGRYHPFEEAIQKKKNQTPSIQK